nr:type II toxin-antitoxin system antitoxin SocA domain-containing protein [uncultured Corynebacterium sp.]
MANVYDVGQYITELVPTVDTMKLYKLCYFSQGWKLAWTGCPLFQEPLQAWANGPIPIALRDRNKPGGDSTSLTTTERRTIESVVDCYRDKDFAELSKLSRGKAWKEARRNLPDNAYSQEVLSVTTMREEFTDLLHSTPNVPSCPPRALIPENYSLETALAAIAKIEKTWGGTLALLATR